LWNSQKATKRLPSRDRKFVDFLFQNYNDSYETSTVLISDDARADPNNYYTAKDIRDLTYTGLDPDLFIAFLSNQKILANSDKFASFSHLSKFYCAIKWGSTTSGRLLPSIFFSKVDHFMACYKKEHVLAKAEGKTQEKEADAVCSTLFKLLMTWCVAEGNVFVWCFSLLMWHLMARSINVD
jgi:hypothetical protein